MKRKQIIPETTIAGLLEKAISIRLPLFDAGHETALRLFNGFTEGNSYLVIDLYAKTAVINDYANPPSSEINVNLITDALKNLLPWLKTIILKSRNSVLSDERNGKIIFGIKADSRIKEHGVWYAVDLCMNRDASLYLDTRNLRNWAIQHLRGKTVLNTFAYTGSLGVAALAGGATRVIQLDRNGTFLELAKKSYSLNGFAVAKKDFLVGDFWRQISRLKHAETRFDCIIIDPPFFAVSSAGTVDMVNNSIRLINKVRPLLNNGGYLVTVNNALYVSGKDYMETLKKICVDGYVSIDELIAVPSDFTGNATAVYDNAITDPAPFNHSTKIAVLKVNRKMP